MAPTAAAMELKVLISVLQQGNILQTMMNQVNQLSQAFNKLQTQASAGGPSLPAPPPVSPLQQYNEEAKKVKLSVEAIEGAVQKAVAAFKFMAGGFLALQSVRFLKGLADSAAEVQVLNTVLHVVAQNAGITTEEIDKVNKSVQKLGITAASSAQSLTSFLQARLDLRYAAPLARAAQDLAVLSGLNSSDTFKRLIVNIQQVDTLGLRWMGIIIDRAAAEEKFKEKIGATTRELNKREQQEALMQAVLEKASLLEGAYSSAMGDVQKQLTSLTRLTETLSATLGNSLLPAYSAIVLVVTKTYEKLILLAMQFSANTQRAQEWADTATFVAETLSTIVTKLAEHLDLIVQLVTWWVEFKLAVIGLNLAGKGLIFLFEALKWFQGLRLATLTLTTAFQGFIKVLQALGVTSATEASKIFLVAEAQTAVAETSFLAQAGILKTTATVEGATAAVTGLTLAWGRMATVMAIPVVGYVLYNLVAKIREEGQKPVLQRAGEELRRLQEQIPSLTIGKALETSLGPHPTGTDVNIQTLREFYRQWREEIGKTGEDSAELRAEFERQVTGFRRRQKNTELDDLLSQARQAQGVARNKLEELYTAQRQAVGVSKQQQEARNLQIAEGERVVAQRAASVRQIEEMIEGALRASNEMASKSPAFVDLSKQIDIAYAAGQKLQKLRNDLRTPVKDVADAQAAFDIEKKRLAVLNENFEARLKAEIPTDEGRRQEIQALANMKARLLGLSDAGDEVRASIQRLFGERINVTPEGVLGGDFSKKFSDLRVLIKAAQDAVDKGKPLEKLADYVSEGVTAVGQAAAKPLDLSKLRQVVGEINKLPIPRIQAKTAEALQLADIGVRQAQEAVGAPIEAQQQRRIDIAEEKDIEAAKRRLERLKTSQAAEIITQEEYYKEGLLSLDQYYKDRVDATIAAGERELAVQEETIEKLEAKKLATRNADQKAEIQNQIDAARNQLGAIAGRTEVDVTRLRSQQRQRRLDLTRDTEAAARAQAAEVGGITAAVEQLTAQIEQERRKIAELRNPLLEEYLIRKQLLGLIEIQFKFAEQTLQVERDRIDAQRQGLDENQRQRNVRKAEDELAVTQGRLTPFEARQNENARIQQASVENRERRGLEINDRGVMQMRQALEMQRLLDRQRIEQATLKPGEAALQILELEQKHTKELEASKVAVSDLDAEYQNLQATVQLYSNELRESFVNGISDALTQSITNFRDAGKAWVSLSQSIANQIVGIFTEALTRRLFRGPIFAVVDRVMNRLFGNTGFIQSGVGAVDTALFKAEGGVVTGPGTGTSDSVPAFLSAGEHIMPAAKAARFMPLLEGIRTGRILPFATGGTVQSIALGSVIPRRYASGGVVVADGGASAVQPAGGVGNMVVTMHPDTLNMTMREWLEHEVVRQQGRR